MTMEPTQPLDGRWCWVRKHTTLPWNTYVYFRRQFELNAIPREARIRISADARYTLQVNGMRAHQGPARSFPTWPCIDELDLSPFLKPGQNVLAATVHQFGVPTFFSVYREVSGLLVDGKIGDVDVSTPGQWLCREARAWKKNVARLSLQLGFQEHFDANTDPHDWQLSQYTPSDSEGWRTPGWTSPSNGFPWLYPEPRGIPLLRTDVHNSAAVVAQHGGNCGAGWETTPDVYHFPQHESRQVDQSLVDAPENLLRADDSVTTIRPPGNERFVSLVLDLGQYRTGHIQLDIASAHGGQVIDLVYSEVMDSKSGFPLVVGRGDQPVGCEEATADRYVCRPGAQQWEPFHYKGMKYVGVIFRNVRAPLEIRHIGIRQVQADLPDIGSFECSDKRLNRVWEVGRETQRNCLFDAFVDCPWREQAMWWGDARVQSKVTAYVFGDSSILARGIRLMSRGQGPDGALHSHPPADAPWHRLPDFMLTWIGSLWDYHFQTEDVALLKEMLPTLERVLKFFERHEVVDGLIGKFDGWWVFLDWQPLYRGDVSGVLNLLYLQALRHAVAVCEAAGDMDASTRYTVRAQRTAAACDKHFWDPARKCWRDGFDLARGAPVEQYSQHMHALGILLDLHPESQQAIAQDLLFKPATQKTDVITASPFFYAYVLEAMIKSGLRTEAVHLIPDKWGAMLDAGATTFWEMWNVTVESHCHAWSSSPVYHLMQQVLGVVPTSPGWRSVRISPVCDGLEFATGKVPTPHGLIEVDWRVTKPGQLALRANIPDGIRAECVGPSGTTHKLSAGPNELAI